MSKSQLQLPMIKPSQGTFDWLQQPHWFWLINILTYFKAFFLLPRQIFLLIPRVPFFFSFYGLTREQAVRFTWKRFSCCQPWSHKQAVIVGLLFESCRGLLLRSLRTTLLFSELFAVNTAPQAVGAFLRVSPKGWQLFSSPCDLSFTQCLEETEMYLILLPNGQLYHLTLPV